MKNIGTKAFFVAVILGIPWLPALAQGPNTQSATMPKISMESMMENCRKDYQSMSGSLDEITKTIAEARESKDVAKLHAALDQVQARVTAIGEQTKKCDDMMAMMQHMMPMQGRGQKTEEHAH